MTTWILDTSVEGDRIALWGPGGAVERVYTPPSFLMALADPARHWAVVDALETEFGTEPVTVRTIRDEQPGWHIWAGKDVAEALLRQTDYTARCYNVDVRRDQRYLAEQGLLPCTGPGEERFSMTLARELVVMDLALAGDPVRSDRISGATLADGDRIRRLRGDERTVLDDLFDLVETVDPDVILFPNADTWMERLVDTAEGYGIVPTISRTGRYVTLDSRSYFSYGRMYHKPKAMVPAGRVLIDTEQSFTYREGGLPGVLVAARITGLSPNRTARFTPGTLVSAFEVYAALSQGIAVPWQKTDAERAKTVRELRAADRGGMMFQPDPGVYERVYQIDFTSLYPAIIVRHNLSPETIEHPERKGFLAECLAPLLRMRIATKAEKRGNPTVAGMDSVLKWMLVTCFGYTGYKNAKFGRVDVHEAITRHARDVLIRSKELAESMRFRVLHGITDCLFVQGAPVAALKAAIEAESGYLTEIETFCWVVFLPQKDGTGAYTWYYGRLDDGEVKVRGIMARRGDCPAYVQRFQEAALALMGTARSVDELRRLGPEVTACYRRYCDDLVSAPIEDLVISRRISTVDYTRTCVERGAVASYRRAGVPVAPGMTIRYVVRDARAGLADCAWEAENADRAYYRRMLAKAWNEVVVGIGAPSGSSERTCRMDGDGMPTWF
jgi:DNA polymerase I